MRRIKATTAGGNQLASQNFHFVVARDEIKAPVCGIDRLHRRLGLQRRRSAVLLVSSTGKFLFDYGSLDSERFVSDGRPKKSHKVSFATGEEADGQFSDELLF